MLTISNQPPDSAVIDNLLREINQSRFIAGLSQRELDALIAAGTILFCYVDEQCVGFAAWTLINAEWCEVGPLLLSASAQGRGYSRCIINQLLEACANYHQYVVTKNPLIKRLYLDYDFQPVALWQLPPVVWFYLLRRVNWLRAVRAIPRLSREPLSHFVKIARDTR